MDVALPNSAVTPPAAGNAAADAARNYQQPQQASAQDKRIWDTVKWVLSWGALSIVVGVKYGLLPGLAVAAVSTLILFLLLRSGTKETERKVTSSFQLVKALMDNNPLAAQGFLDSWATLTHDERDPTGRGNLEMAFHQAKTKGYNDLTRQLVVKLKTLPNAKQDWGNDELMSAVIEGNAFLIRLFLETWDFTDADFIGMEFNQAAEKKQMPLIAPFLERYSALIAPDRVLRVLRQVPDDMAIEISRRCFPHHADILNVGRATGFLMGCCNENRVALVQELLNRPLSASAAMNVYFMLDKSQSSEMTQCLQDKIKRDRLYEQILQTAESGEPRLTGEHLEKLRKRRAELT